MITTLRQLELNQHKYDDIFKFITTLVLIIFMLNDWLVFMVGWLVTRLLKYNATDKIARLTMQNYDKLRDK